MSNERASSARENRERSISAPAPQSRYFEVEGLKLHYLDWGGDETQRTFVLLHGGGAHVHWWDSVAPMLAEHGRVYALDFRGHGRSQWANPPVYGPASYFQDAQAFIGHLNAKVVLVGHSMGGAVSQ